MRKVFILFITLPVIWSCESEGLCDQKPDEFYPIPPIEIERLENQILDIDTNEELISFAKSHPVIANYFLRTGDYPDELTFANSLTGRFTNPHIDSLQMEIEKVFGDLRWMEQQFTDAFSYMKYYYPNFTIPKIKTVATGLNNGADLYISDTLIVIGLDFYLGKESKYQPLGFPKYILDRYSQEYLVPSCILLYGISPSYNKTSLRDKTMLADMIAFGKSFRFAKTMMPCTPDSLLIWYSGKELSDVRKNQQIIWGHFLDNELLYTTDNFLKQKYVGERPKTLEIGTSCPGRIGTWLGWDIVNQYAEKNDHVSLQDLMNESEVGKIFELAKYRPKN